MTAEKNWILRYESEDGATSVEDLDGVEWNDAPLPSRVHGCTPQTRGWIRYFTQVFRCACGAIGETRHGRTIEWIEKNSRRREPEPTDIGTKTNRKWYARLFGKGK